MLTSVVQNSILFNRFHWYYFHDGDTGRQVFREKRIVIHKNIHIMQQYAQINCIQSF